MVTVVNTEDISYTNYCQLNENEPICINDIKIGFLQKGSLFDLKKWNVVGCVPQVKPLHEIKISN